MGELLSVLPRGDSPRERAERRDILTEVKLLVAYCKRKGALVLSEESNPEFDRDRRSSCLTRRPLTCAPLASTVQRW